jgi:hypothetical protein
MGRQHAGLPRARRRVAVPADEDIAPPDTSPMTNSTPNSLEGSMTRARARHLNYEVSPFLILHTNIHEDGMLLKSCDVLLLRNMGSTPFTSSQPPLMPTLSSTPSLCSSNKRLHAQD